MTKIAINARTAAFALWLTLAPGSTVFAANVALEFVYGEPPAPALVVEHHGKTEPFDLTSLKGQVVLVNFWGTWCPPCRAEMPSIAELKQRFEGRPFEVVAVHVGPGSEEIDRFAESSTVPLDFIIAVDDKNATFEDWKVRGLPLTWILDHNGNQVWKATGDREWNHDDIANRIDKMVKKAEAAGR